MDLPNFYEMTPKQVREWGVAAAFRASQYGDMKATMQVNCQEGGMLHKHGCEYDDTKMAVTNLANIMMTLCDKIDRLEADDAH